MMEESSTKYRVESVRVLIYFVCLVVLLFSFFLQSPFISWDLLGPSFISLGLGFILHLVLFLRIDKWKEDSLWIFISFIFDSIILSYFIYKSGSYQSLFLFFQIIHIVLSSFLFKGKGALALALLASILFSCVQLMGPDFKSLSFLIVLGINNLSFFAVASLSGYLSERLLTAEKTVQEKQVQIKSLEELNELIIEKSPVGMITFDNLFNIYQMNLRALSMFPFVKTEDKITDFLLPLKEFWNDILNIELNQEWIKEFTLAKEADYQFFRVIITKISKSNSLFLLLIEDFTKIKKLEFNLKQSEKLAAVGGLAAGVAHEIRNPLAGISGSIELLSQTTNNDDDKKLMKIILREIDRLNNLITEFLDYAKPEKPPEDPCDLVFILKEVLENIKNNSKLNQSVVLKINLPPNAMVKGYKDKLKQAFLNIIINAYQAMEKKQEAFLEISLIQSSDRWNLLIKDSGDGMKKETLKRLFEPFYTTKSKGTGLGLAVAYKIFESHQALVFVRSELGQGTEFEFNFPCLGS